MGKNNTLQQHNSFDEKNQDCTAETLNILTVTMVKLDVSLAYRAYVLYADKSYFKSMTNETHVSWLVENASRGVLHNACFSDA